MPLSLNNLDEHEQSYILDVLRKNSLIFRAMKMLYDSGTAIDITTVANQLNNTKDLSRVGGVDYLVNLAKCVTTFKNVEYYVKNCHNRHKHGRHL